MASNAAMRHERPANTHPNSETLQEPLREREAARYVGMSIPFLRQARMYGRGPAYLRVGRAIRYLTRDLDAWMQAHRVEPGVRGSR
jgi:hypothetical protein